MTAFTELFSNHLNTLNKKGIFQTHIAKDLGISNTFLSDIKLGLRKINPELLNKFIEIYKLSDKEALKLHRAAAQGRGFRV